MQFDGTDVCSTPTLERRKGWDLEADPKATILVVDLGVVPAVG